MEQKNGKWKMLLGLGVVILVLIILFVSGIFDEKMADETYVPDENPTTMVDKNASTTDSTAPIMATGGPEGSEENPILTYQMEISEGKFIPETTTIEKGKKIQIAIIALDDDYDVSFPDPISKYLSIKKEQTAVFGLLVDVAGSYAFSCRDICPAGGELKGTLIVN